MKIDIPKHLINLRNDIVQQKLGSPLERMIYRLWAWSLKSPTLYKLITIGQKLDLRRRAKKTGWIEKVPAPASGWTQIRSMPPPAAKTFHQMWKKRP